jgi:hypothetical protein
MIAVTFSSNVLAASQKVTVCHATSSESHPYNKITPDISSSGPVDGGHAGHGGDGVWYNGAKGDGFEWGDIIPPYVAGDFTYAGLNWTEAGQAIWNNDCKLQGEVVEPTPSFDQNEGGTTDAPSDAPQSDPPSTSDDPGTDPSDGVADPTPSFINDVAALTQAPTDTAGRATSNSPAGGAWLLVVALGVLLSSIVVLTPARAKRQR